MLARYRDEVERSGESELLILGAIVKPGELAIDVGANLGAYAFALSQQGVRVIACEPNPDLALLLRGMGMRDVTVFEVAVSDTNGTAQMAIPLVRSGHVLSSLRDEMLTSAGYALQRFPVVTKTLDELSAERVAFVKIDVEGHEESAVRGAHRLIERDHPVFLIEIEERHNPGGIERIRSILEGYGYSTYFHYDKKWRAIAEFRPEEHQNAERAYGGPVRPSQREALYAGNFLFLPPSKGISLITEYEAA